MTIDHVDVGSYALGLLEDADRQAFEEHLAGCAVCQAEMDELSGFRSMLAGVEPVDPVELAAPRSAGGRPAGEPPDNVVDILRHSRRREARRRRATYLLGAAAGIAVLATGAFVGAGLSSDGGTTPSGDPLSAHHSPAAQLLATGERHSATDPRTGAVGTVSLERQTWGTHVALDLRNVRGPLACRLVGITGSGAQVPVTSWKVPVKGYGVPGSPDPLQIHGGAAAPRDDITRFAVLVEGGGTLVTVPV